jgi:hypothetical protein
MNSARIYINTLIPQQSVTTVESTAKKESWYVLPLFLIGFVLLLPFLLFILPILFTPGLYARFIQRPPLLRRVKKEWLPKNIYILFVYSDNALWKKYAEEHIIPKIEAHSVVLNWSYRKEWMAGNSLEAQLFRNFEKGGEQTWREHIRMGGQPYNHMAIVFKPWNRPKVISFWDAFKEYKFGREEELKKVEEALYQYV